ncbi:MAG: prepilin-type N-terminal cleavage/methylation domain-containing protein [Burkholderiales bacterium]|nr:prepilin-type N-terminal cleavage/methylation domain-containing protein [Burkholderiales bacterium]
MTPSVQFTQHRRARRASGFTLIELMVTVAVIAILAAIALPSYRSYVLRSHRSDGLSALTQDQAIMERCYAQNFVYSASCAGFASSVWPQTTPGGYYSINLVVTTAPAGYTFTATPLNSQVADTTCATIRIDQANQKVGLDSGGNPQPSCWNP